MLQNARHGRRKSRAQSTFRSQEAHTVSEKSTVLTVQLGEQFWEAMWLGVLFLFGIDFRRRRKSALKARLAELAMSAAMQRLTHFGGLAYDILGYAGRLL